MTRPETPYTRVLELLEDPVKAAPIIRDLIERVIRWRGLPPDRARDAVTEMLTRVLAADAGVIPKGRKPLRPPRPDEDLEHYIGLVGFGVALNLQNEDRRHLAREKPMSSLSQQERASAEYWQARLDADPSRVAEQEQASSILFAVALLVAAGDLAFGRFIKLWLAGYSAGQIAQLLEVEVTRVYRWTAELMEAATDLRPILEQLGLGPDG